VDMVTDSQYNWSLERIAKRSRVRRLIGQDGWADGCSLLSLTGGEISVHTYVARCKRAWVHMARGL
jgi:hypothetical protein